MQYAEIAVNTKTSFDHQIFTYKITPEHLAYVKKGVLVLVPFRGKEKEGIIISLKHFNNLTYKHKLKSISKIIDSEPMLSNDQIELARKVSDYYLSPISEVLFMMIPPVALRQVSSEYNSNIINNNKQKLSSHKYVIYDRIENRIEAYAKIAKNALKNQFGSIILFPKIDGFENAIEKLKKFLPYDQIAVIHGNLKISERFKVYKEILSGNKNIIIGARSAIFSPVKNLGLVIIDQPEDFGYKEDQSPRYNAIDVAKIMNKTFKINIIFGGIISQVEDYYEMLNKKYRVIKNKSCLNNNIDITIVDQNKERSFISNSLETRIKQFLNNKKILVYVPKKGDGSSLICTDCGYNFICPRCDLLLFPKNNFLNCIKCNIKKNIPSTCPNCNGTKLKSTGVGTEKIKNELLKTYSGARINIIEGNSSLNKSLYDKSNIIIATKKIFNENYKFHLTAALNIDGLINQPDYKASEKLLFDLTNLIELTENQLLIQTFNPDNFILNNLKKPKKILDKILSERIKYNYPPFSKIIKLTINNKYENKCLSETDRLLKKLLNEKLINKLEIVGSGPSFISKKRDKYFYQIIIKYASINEALIRKQLSEIKQISGWSIDINPISLI